MTHYDLFRLAVTLLVLAAVVAGYRTVILSEPANAVRRVTRLRFLVPVAYFVKPVLPRLADRLFRRAQKRDRIPAWKHWVVWWVALGKCRTCHGRFDQATIQTDHWYTAWSDGGSDSIWNFAALCPLCNRWKRTRNGGEHLEGVRSMRRVA